MSGFEWDDDFEWDAKIGEAKMNAGKTTQVFNHCTKTLIPSLNERRAWVFYVRALNPELSEVLLPEFPEERYFKYIGRWFALKHDAKKKLWRLSFLRFVKDHPPSGGARAQDGEAAEARGQMQNEPNRGPNGEDTTDNAVLRIEQEKRRSGLHAMQLWLEASYSCARVSIGKWRRGAIVAKWNLLDAMERAQEELLAACATLRLRRGKVAVSLTAMVREVRAAAANAPHQVAALRRKRVLIGGSMAIDLCVFAPQPARNAWQLGETRQVEPAAP
jgi:hypothetical protein